MGGEGCWRLFFWSVFLWVLALTPSGGAFGTKCRRSPPLSTVPKTPGDNGYKIKISGNPEKYVPGEVYTVSIQGWRNQFSGVQKFIGFLLVVESGSTPVHLYGPQSVGTFQLYGDVLTMHSDECPNAVVHTSNIPKSEVQVLWTAPPAGSGCVRFKATVIEQKETWFMDDGELAKELCEEVQENEDMQPEVISDCCTCDEAKYEVTFEGLWSRQTHPKDFPKNEWLTHFSDIIGASHSNDYRVWEYGGLASDGLRQVAEWGSTRKLESELKRESDHIRTIIKARGLWHQKNLNKKTFAVFRVDNKHHLMSLVSMLGPSPDWIVGVSALELCLSNCSWVFEKKLNLYPWDAGTDSGVTYESPNSVTVPRERIRRITNSYPNNLKSPFYDPKGLPMKPLARLTVARQRVYEKSCSNADLTDSDDNYLRHSDEDADRPECAVTQWSNFSPCPVTCGKSIRLRTRLYVNRLEAERAGCRRQIEENEMCAASVPFCEGSDYFNFFGGEAESDVCMTTEWSLWSPCSVTCGKGFTMRTRKYLDRMGRKKCSKELTEKHMCMAPITECKNTALEEQIDPACAVTQWTYWSPCSASCGFGVRARTRHFLVPVASQAGCQVPLMEKQQCEGERRDCSIDPMEAKEVCMLEPDHGDCRGHYLRWYYDSNRGMCIQFNYGGCTGNRNNFERYDECVKVCELTRGQNPLPSLHSHREDLSTFVVPPLNETQPRRETRKNMPAAVAEPKVDCMVSEWSDWSTCSVSCGRGTKEKNRMIKVHPQNGGKRCPKRLIKRRGCKGRRCKSKQKNLKSMSLLYDRPVEYSSPLAPEPAYFHSLVSASHKLDLSHDEDKVDDELEFELEGQDETVDCVTGEWGPWSPCTLSCGQEALQQRERSVIVKARGGGKQCGPRLERRYCDLPPCSYPRG